MKVLWPTSVFLIRGNHEFSQLWRQGGFENELELLYPGARAADAFEKTFATMPLGAIVNQTILCLHGGIGPHVPTIEAVAILERPIVSFENETVLDVLWSDPSANVDEFGPSRRGIGHLFGASALSRFFSESKIDVLVRGHECADEGFAWQLGGRVLTVFSASAYCNVMTNKSGVAIVRKAGLAPQSFPSLRWIFRDQAHFLTSADQRSFVMDLDAAMAFRYGPMKLPVLLTAGMVEPSGTRRGIQCWKSLSMKSKRGPRPLEISSSTVIMPFLLIEQGIRQKWRTRRVMCQGL
jgi:protein phosphatase